MAAAATPLDPSCDHQPLANGHHRFLLRDIPSDAPDCSSSSWEDQNVSEAVTAASAPPVPALATAAAPAPLLAAAFPAPAAAASVPAGWTRM